VPYFKDYKVYAGEEGWYVYFQPNDPRCRAIREGGPMSKEDAERLVERLEKRE